ncbi:MAG: hypothetical protein AAF242_02965, partial [Bacteroidota bacterium]
SYQDAFAFVEPKTPLAFTDDTYECLLNCPPKVALPEPPINPGISWAEAFSFALRQPHLAKALGLVYELEIKLDPKDIYEYGGWLFFSLADSSDYAHLLPEPNFIKVFGTKVPKLSKTDDQALFTPVLFPVVDDPAITVLPGNFDEAFLEANRYYDGFAKIVHGAQAKHQNHLNEGDDGRQPTREEGVQLGWDDEDLVIAQNRQLGLDPETMAEPAEAPMGVVGYRVDVREAGTTAWNSLSKVQTDKFIFGGIDFGALKWESRSEVFPSTVQEQFWLPTYFTRWKGSSLVVNDVEDLLLAGVEQPNALYYKSEDALNVPLKYGKEYEFRVRMVDTTNGGPQLSDEPSIPGESPICGVPFQRFVPPQDVNWPEVDPSPEDASIMKYTISRPTIAAPQALYTNYPDIRNTLLGIQKANQGLGVGAITDPVVPDPDTPTLGIRVLVKAPDFDPHLDQKDIEGYIEWYSTTRAFPVDLDSPYDLELKFEDAAQLSAIDLSDQMAALPIGPLVLPTARDIQIELRAIGRPDADYFAHDRARQGAASSIKLHKKATVESNFFMPQAPQDSIRSIYMQATDLENERQVSRKVLQNGALPVLVQRLASAVQLVANDRSLMMPPGERGVFGCSKGLQHYLPANNSSLVFMSADELQKQWINVLQWKIDRDWTWKGFGAPTFVVERALELNGNAYKETRQAIGEVKMMHAVSPLVGEEASPERESFSFVFLDAFKSPLGTDGLPYEVEVSYFITAYFENGQKEEVPAKNVLPITSAPTQIPKVISAGVALSPYEIGDAYASTNDRQKMLWLEFAEAPKDPRDNYFVRVLAQNADPMLLQNYEPLDEPAGYQQWSLDPESIRMITPGQSDDFAGLTSMQRLIPAKDSDRHYLVPLPSGTYPDSPELFGFYTYEIRVGHDKGGPGPANPFWSTAQGRFGTAITLDGVQHPPAPLKCNVNRVDHGLLVSSDYASPYDRGQNVQSIPPNTQIWYVLYAQVHQADGLSMRNIELDKRLGHFLRRKEMLKLKKTIGVDLLGVNPFAELSGKTLVQNRQAGLQAHVLWQQNEIIQLLRLNGLPDDTPISVLGIELLPEPTGQFDNPLGGNLGEVRILRTSALYRVSELCC